MARHRVIAVIGKGTTYHGDAEARRKTEKFYRGFTQINTDQENESLLDRFRGFDRFSLDHVEQQRPNTAKSVLSVFIRGKGLPSDLRLSALIWLNFLWFFPISIHQ